MSGVKATVLKLLQEGKLAKAEAEVKGISDNVTKLSLEAEVALAKEDYAEAIKAAKEAWPLAKSSGDKQTQAEVLSRMARGIYLKGSKRASMSVLKTAHQAINGSMPTIVEAGDVALEAEMIHTLALVYIRMEELNGPSGSEEALAAEEKAIATFKKISNKAGEAASLVTMAQAEYMLSRFGESIESATKAATLFRSLGKAAGVISALGTILKAQASVGSADNTVRTLHEEVAAFKASGSDDTNQFKMYEYAVEAALEYGKKSAALEFLEELISLYGEKGMKVEKAKTMLQAAGICSELGAMSEGASQAYEASMIFKDVGDTQSARQATQLHDAINSAGDKAVSAVSVLSRAEAKVALKNFVRAAEARDVDQTKKAEADMNRHGAGLKDQELQNAFQLLFLQDSGAMQFLEDLGWDLSAYKESTTITTADHRIYYAGMHWGGLNFGPQFQVMHPHRLGLFTANTDVRPMAVLQRATHDVWFRDIQIPFTYADAGLQAMGAASMLPPYPAHV